MASGPAPGSFGEGMVRRRVYGDVFGSEEDEVVVSLDLPFSDEEGGEEGRE